MQPKRVCLLILPRVGCTPRFLFFYPTQPSCFSKGLCQGVDVCPGISPLSVPLPVAFLRRLVSSVGFADTITRTNRGPTWRLFPGMQKRYSGGRVDYGLFGRVYLRYFLDSAALLVASSVVVKAAQSNTGKSNKSIKLKLALVQSRSTDTSLGPLTAFSERMVQIL